MQDNTTKRKLEIVFINYLSRSGSTLLCDLLDRYKGISVGIEAGFPGAIAKLIPDSYKQIKDDAALERYLDELYRDIRFKDWKVDRKRLFERLQTEGYPLTFRSVLRACFDEYFGENDADIYIHKAGYYIDILDEVRDVFGDSVKNIYITRDPRAVYSSQNSATCIYSGTLMGRCLANFVYQYKKRARIANSDNTGNLLCLKYEDLIEDSGKVVESVLTFLGLPEAVIEGGSYAARIPDGQKHLHENVGSAPNMKSFNKWQTKLAAHEVRFIQKKLSGEMRGLGYEPIKLGNPGVTGLVRYLGLEVKFRYASLLRFVGKQ